MLAWALAEVLQLRVLGLLAKPLPALCLAIWVAARDRQAGAISAGLVLSALGDLLLALDLFLGGMAAFAVAHAAYITAFLHVSSRPRLLLAVPYAAWAVGMDLLLWPGLGALALPVAAYSALLAAMMWRAAACVGTAPRRWPAAIGAALFGLSDMLIALDRFRAEVPGAAWWIMSLYWAGLWGIAASVRRAR
jgi:uncharacterized membrane protein YhhN